MAALLVSDVPATIATLTNIRQAVLTAMLIAFSLGRTVVSKSVPHTGYLYIVGESHPH
jgi:hypothetical protein